MTLFRDFINITARRSEKDIKMSVEQIKRQIEQIILESFRNCDIGDNIKANIRQISTWVLERCPDGLDLISECFKDLQQQGWFDSEGNYLGKPQS